MSFLLKSLFNFNNGKQRDLEITQRISKIESMIKDLEKQKQTDLPIKIKLILNAGLFQQKGESLFELVYKTCCQCSPVEWVPVISRTIQLFSANSSFMKVIQQIQDYKIPIEKHFIPNYLFRNNLLNENAGYQGLSNSISGLMVPIMDYVFIRLMHAIHETEFWPLEKDANSQYESDDMFLHISRNPYLLLLRNYFEGFSNSQRQLEKLAGNVKMFFVDQLMLKHRINKSSNYLRECSIFTSQRKIKPHFILVLYLLLDQGRKLFQERYMFFYELITRFGSLIESENSVFFRFFFRVFLFAYSKSLAETKVIQRLSSANEKDGVFDVERYSIKDYRSNIEGCDTAEKKYFNESKTLLLKLLEKDYNLTSKGRVHFSLIRTLGCFLAVEINVNHSSRYGSNGMEKSDALRIGSEAASIQTAIERICMQTIYMKRKEKKAQNKLNKRNEQKLDQEIEQINSMFLQAYKRQIDMSKFQDHKQTKSAAEVGIRGNSQDFTFSVETYRREIDVNCWKVPLKDSEYLVLYELFYAIAKALDRVNPWAKAGSEPSINLRYFCNPVVFMLSVIVLVLVLKVIF